MTFESSLFSPKEKNSLSVLPANHPWLVKVAALLPDGDGRPGQSGVGMLVELSFRPGANEAGAENGRVIRSEVDLKLRIQLGVFMKRRYITDVY